MERILTPDERIRRAEEIYYRKKIQANYQGVNRTGNSILSKNSNFGMLKKMLFQILICVLIYSGFYLMNVTNHVFSEDMLNRTKGILSYNMDFNALYNQIVEYFNELITFRWRGRRNRGI
ncbi:MAG: hypothetical protein FWC68_04980 [Oscillospiraceae bacterium]|nr:hypothetical protein [Oscillospiraceae bacterium]